MSRIDISVTDKASGELIANRGFCRSSHLSFFCEESEDSRLQDFANSLFMGVSLTEDTIKDFLETVEYTVSYLEGTGKDENRAKFSADMEESYRQFISDLKDSIDFIQSLNEAQNLGNLEVDII